MFIPTTYLHNQLNTCGKYDISCLPENPSFSKKVNFEEAEMRMLRLSLGMKGLRMYTSEEQLMFGDKYREVRLKWFGHRGVI